MNLADTLKDSNYKLSQFTVAEIEQLEQSITPKATKSGEVPYIVCLVRQKAIKLNENGMGYPVLRLNEFESNFTGTPAKYCHLIDEATFQSLKLRKGDVVICRTNGNPKLVGKSALVPKDTNFAFASYVFRVQPKKHLISSEVLTVFLNSQYGRQEIEKYSMTGNQTNFSPAKFREIQVPHFIDTFQKIINKLVEKAYHFLENSKLFYQQAEDLLLSELALKDWQPTEENVTAKSFSESFLSSGRFDAEYYQPKYDQFYNCLKTACSEKRWELKRLGNLSSLFKYGTSEPFEYLDQGVPFLRIADLQKYRFGEKDLKFISQEAAKQQQANVKTGDVLISRSGTLGLAVVITQDLNNAVYGSYFILTRPNQKSIFPTYLAFYLNSLVGKLQTEQANTGGIQTNLTIPVLESLLIACPPLEINRSLSIRSINPTMQRINPSNC